MAAFERISSGIPQMDKCLDNMRLGDNVVWRVSDLEEFRQFMLPYVDQAVRDKRNLIYIRFAEHPPLLEPREGLKIVNIELSHRFEKFTVQIHDLIAKEGRGAFYVFDCLSSLQTAWATDLMMGAFFHLTCPYLFELDTLAFFPILRGRHSFETIAVIRDTTQLFLDVYSSEGSAGNAAVSGENGIYYVRPIKVWNRYLPTMFLPHVYEPAAGRFEPIMDGIEVSSFYQRMNDTIRENQDLNTDSWHRLFQNTEILFRNGIDVSDACARMCEIMLTRDRKLRVLIKENFQPQDYFEISRRMIGTGLIGGKATGMLLARKLVQNSRPDIYARLEPHDSYYVGSDVFYTYLVDNELWDLHLRQRKDEGYFALSGQMKEKIMGGHFSASLQEQFARLLDYYGQDPVIVRSSSILEDGFGNAFAGKYESVFCSNSGTPQERLEEFENAVRTVYASTLSLSALDYRMRRGLDKRDEQMALLVQRVSGSRRADHFLPCAAGVGYSVSPYRLSPDQQEKGMLRLVMGLGTAAVDRERSYPRIVALDSPEKVTAVTDTQRQQYSQQEIDAVNTLTGSVDGLSCGWAAENFPRELTELLMSHNRDTERMFRERGQKREIYFASCDGIVKNRQLMADMSDILKLLMDNYECPVDIEYTINISRAAYVIDLLQCRPLQQQGGGGVSVKIPADIPAEKIFLKSRDASMGFSRKVELDYIVYIDPVAYYNMPYRDKYRVRDALGRINWHFRGKGRHLMLLAPGRICTSSPELGVPTTFADISEFEIIAEVAETRAGYMPELSYGSHIFQDLVEAQILYTAVFADAKTERFAPELLGTLPQAEADYMYEGGRPDGGPEPAPENAVKLSDIVKLYDASGRGCSVCYDMIEKELLGELG